MRMILLAAALLAGASPLAAQTATAPAPILTTPEAKDVWTHADPEVARVTHVSLNLDVDFATRTLGGTATLDLLVANNAQSIVLDADNLAISSVTDANGKPLKWAVGDTDPELGSALPVE